MSYQTWQRFRSALRSWDQMGYSLAKVAEASDKLVNFEAGKEPVQTSIEGSRSYVS